MIAPNINTLWGRIIVDELAKAGLDGAVIAPGSRSTPLTVAFAEHPDIETFSQLDERSAAFFALGRGKRTGRPTALVCTSGTALANFHPAVIEADRTRVPMVLLTANRPPELQGSGANQTITQERLYGDSVRTYRKLPEPEAADRKLRSLRVALDRAVAASRDTPAGPVQLDVPFRKPLEPTVATDEIPPGFEADYPLAVRGRDGPFVSVERGRRTLEPAALDRLVTAIERADSGLIVCGPADRSGRAVTALAALARASGFPVAADPLSGLRFGEHTEGTVVCGGYDSYLPAVEETPDVVIRFGAAPTSKTLQHYLRDADCRQFVVDPAGSWREATFTATDLVVADETWLASELANRVTRETDAYAPYLRDVESRYWRLVTNDEPVEGAVLADVAASTPDPSTVFVSNSMPVRDFDRFARPRAANLTVLGNRGASGIDGIASTALGARSATEEPLTLVTGDLAYYHDMNGLVAVSRCNVDATIIVVNNDGGGIFRILPIESHDTFDEWFRTPHGLDFKHSAAMYDLEFVRTDDRERFRELYTDSVERDGTQVIEVVCDGERNHDDRVALQERVVEELSGQ